MKWPRSSLTKAVTCVFAGFTGTSAPRAVFTTLPV